MRLFVSGSAPLLMETFNEFKTRTGHTILERYGMTEGNMFTSNPYDGERRGGTVGFPLPGVSIRIVDDENRPVQEGGIGQILVKGENVFRGYWRMPEKTREEFTDDGFFKTGDMGKRDNEGYISIVGRSKDLIITGGLNVYPKEIEEMIDTLPGVFESAVVGAAPSGFGEAVVAVIVRQDNEAGSRIDRSRHHRQIERRPGQLQSAETRPFCRRPAAQQHGKGPEKGLAGAVCLIGDCDLRQGTGPYRLPLRVRAEPDSCFLPAGNG